MKLSKRKSNDQFSQDGIVSSNASRWIAIGMCLGIVVGAATDNVGLWMSLGLCFGVAISSTINQKKNKESSNPKPKRKRTFSGSSTTND